MEIGKHGPFPFPHGGISRCPINAILQNPADPQKEDKAALQGAKTNRVPEQGPLFTVIYMVLPPSSHAPWQDGVGSTLRTWG